MFYIILLFLIIYYISVITLFKYFSLSNSINELIRVTPLKQPMWILFNYQLSNCI